MKNKKFHILILGGRGFVGKAIAKELKNHDIYTFDRHSGGKNHIQGSILSQSELDEAIKNQDIVINLVGLTPIKKPKGTTYYDVHVKGVKNILKSCKKNKIKKLIHHSALNADKKSDIGYVKTKGISEELVLKSPLKVTVFCPSIIIDKDNELIKMASTFAFTCAFPKIPAIMQPIMRKDVAKLHKLAVEGKIRQRKLNIAGEQKISIFEIVKKIHHKKGFPCLPIPLLLTKCGMQLARIFHLFGISKDQIKNLQINNTTKNNQAKKYVKLTSFDSWLKKARL